MSRFSEAKELVEALEADFTKFYEQGNKAAGTRIRKGMQDLKNLAQDVRNEVSAIKNGEK
ncbi:histone H1 [Echinicola marina]|uniref:histone H1 n=1 Tax=Echinicola marina TaxID=2859768 RepID=UPI001CF67A96|nr:histone H1 [Echinicola marina]UCS92045.1 histone H1 [Echinicola marina]